MLAPLWMAQFSRSRTTAFSLVIGAQPVLAVHAIRGRRRQDHGGWDVRGIRGATAFVTRPTLAPLRWTIPSPTRGHRGVPPASPSACVEFGDRSLTLLRRW